MIRVLVLTALLVAVPASLASPVAAASCKCPKNYYPYGVPWAGSGQMYWECVRKAGTYARGQHPAPVPCKGQSHLGPA
jgi:hypothetical protein